MTVPPLGVGGWPTVIAIVIYMVVGLVVGRPDEVGGSDPHGVAQVASPHDDPIALAPQNQRRYLELAEPSRQVGVTHSMGCVNGEGLPVGRHRLLWSGPTQADAHLQQIRRGIGLDRIERLARKLLDEEAGGAPGGVRTYQRNRLDRALLGEGDAGDGIRRERS